MDTYGKYLKSIERKLGICSPEPYIMNKSSSKKGLSAYSPKKLTTPSRKQEASVVEFQMP